MVCEELHNLYSSPLISTTTEWAGRVERMSINVYQISAEQPEEST